MSEIKIFFLDGSFEIFHEDKTFKLYEKRLSDWEPVTSYFDVKSIVTLFKPSNKGMASEFMDSLADIEFFEDIETGSVYKVSSIVKMINL